MRFFLSVFFLITQFSFGQNLKKHQWENRVLLIISNDKNNTEFKNQIQLLKSVPSELKERKLILYQIHPKEYLLGFGIKWKKSEKLYQKFNRKKDAFKIILIGLDGGIKLSQKSKLSTKKLFTIIDGMPIRKRELNKQN